MRKAALRKVKNSVQTSGRNKKKIPTNYTYISLNMEKKSQRKSYLYLNTYPPLVHFSLVLAYSKYSLHYIPLIFFFLKFF